jgi:hypothetical protein
MIYDTVGSGRWYVLFGKSDFLHVQEISEKPCLHLQGRNVFKLTLKTEVTIYSEAFVTAFIPNPQHYHLNVDSCEQKTSLGGGGGTRRDI